MSVLSLTDRIVRLGIVRETSLGFLGTRSSHLSRAAGEVGRGSGREGAAVWASSALGLTTATLSRALEPDLSRRER
jgi:hypothetical protein